MGLHTQPNDWTCGPFALKHALLTLGKMVEGEDLARIAGTHWWRGTDEIGLARAAKSQGCELPLLRKRTADSARKQLVQNLRSRIPVLLCVDNWGHWITVVSHERGHFVLIDSLAEPVITIVTWSQLRRRWRYLDVDYDDEEPPELYEMFPLVPRTRPEIRANFSLARIRFLRRRENHALALAWTTYLGDLLAICRPPSPRQLERLSMSEFLRRHQALIVSRVLYWHGDIERTPLQKLLQNFRFVAETYGLVIPAANARQAIADIAILVTMWAVASRGINEIYGAGPR